MPRWHEVESGDGSLAVYDAAMDVTVINIGWVYFLGMIGGLIAIAYYANCRLTALAMNTEWLREMVTELLVAHENDRAELFNNTPQLSLTTKGYHALARSGLRSYIDANKRRLLSQIGNETLSSAYELQSRAFRVFADLSLEEPVARNLNTFAFANGTSPTLLRRLGAIYLRDIALHS